MEAAPDAVFRTCEGACWGELEDAVADVENSRTRRVGVENGHGHGSRGGPHDLTSLGLSFHGTVRQLKIWAETHRDEVSAHQALFDDVR